MRKIMFNDKYGLTKAVLEGRNTMTRRIIKDENGLYADIRCMKFSHLNEYGNAVMRSSIGFAELVPRYKVGEVVAVAQSYLSIHNEMMDESFGEGYGDGVYDAFRWAIVDDKPGWRNKMFVKADLVPHQIRITNVRVERLQDISDEDCLKEGILNCKDDPDFSHLQKDIFYHEGSCDGYITPREAFAALIDKVSGKGTWESNPYVLVYEFELVK